MKNFRLTITQEIIVGFDGNSATPAHAEYIVKECARLFVAEGETNTLGRWSAKGGMVKVLDVEPLDASGWPLPKKEKPEAEAPGTDENPIF